MITVTRPRPGSKASNRTFYVNLNGSGISSFAFIATLTGLDWVEVAQRKRGPIVNTVSNSVRVLVAEGVKEAIAEHFLWTVINAQLRKVSAPKKIISRSTSSKSSDITSTKDQPSKTITVNPRLLPAKATAAPSRVSPKLSSVIAAPSPVKPDPTATAKSLLKMVLDTKFKNHTIAIETPDGVKITITR